MELVIATGNKDKLREIKTLLKGLKVNISSLNDYPRIPKIKEDGKTFKENALKKATVVAKFTGKLSVADDSGLEVKALDGRPGIYSSRFAGKNVTYKDNNRKLLRLLKDTPLSRRKARFVCSVAIVAPQGRTLFVQGTCQGTIGFTPKGKSGFGFDPLFMPRGYKKSFAELGPGIKNRLSHRAKAFKKAKTVILKHFL